MAYADYTYYIDIYKGRILLERDFAYYSERAAEFMDNVTFGRIKTQNCALFEDNIKKCNCELAEYAYKSNMRNIISETIGDYSVSYAQYAQQAADIRKNQYQIIAKHLLDTGLMYRGV